MASEKRKFLGTVDVRAKIDGEEKVVGSADIIETSHGQTANVTITEDSAKVLFETDFTIDEVPPQEESEA